MPEESSHEQPQASDSPRKPWEPPQIVLERLLMATAQQGGPPGSQGFIGPLGVSGGNCGFP